MKHWIQRSMTWMLMGSVSLVTLPAAVANDNVTTDDLSVVDCDEQAIYDAQLIADEANSFRRLGLLSAGVGAPIGAAFLLIRSGDEKTLRKNQALVAAFGRFIEIDAERIRLQREFGQIMQDIRQFVVQHGLEARIHELKEAAKKAGKSVNPEDIFKGSNVTQSEQARFNGLQTKRALNLAEQQINRDRWDREYGHLKRISTVSFRPTGKAGMAQTAGERAKVALGSYEGRVETFRNQAAKVRIKRMAVGGAGLGLAIGGLATAVGGAGLGLAIGGLAIYYFADDLAIEVVADQRADGKMSSAEEQALAKALLCLGRKLHGEEPVQGLPGDVRIDDHFLGFGR